MKEMKLIVDAGSTKTAWALCVPGGEPLFHITAGCNALTASAEDVRDITADAIGGLRLVPREVTEVKWFGAGCATEEVCSRLADIMAEFFSGASVHVGSDLEGAAVALFPKGDGIACILGTGSNSGLFLEGKIVANTPPLGYILGDEGSGVALGKRLIRDTLRGELPQELADELARDYGITRSNVLDHVYRLPGANTFLASVAPFLKRHSEHPDVRHIIIEEFTAFIINCLSPYPDSRSYPLGFAGSIAAHFADELREVASSLGYTVTNIVADPISELARRACFKN